ncbi:hypothetical protein AB833_13805 [Chromatiales bacterium (ex Bugula neritina AB1)]|nr:hypothetical protein AB833_13805 [Chromatiales bacterium (ex Bugula neritina AB1)]
METDNHFFPRVLRATNLPRCEGVELENCLLTDRAADQFKLKCACVGGDSRVPLGFVSLTENIMMIQMGSYTLYRLIA